MNDFDRIIAAIKDQIAVCTENKDQKRIWVYLTVDDAKKIIAAADALTHCRDCLHFNRNDMPEEGCGYCFLLERTYTANDYCSYGDKRVCNAVTNTSEG